MKVAVDTAAFLYPKMYILIKKIIWYNQKGSECAFIILGGKE